MKIFIYLTICASALLSGCATINEKVAAKIDGNVTSASSKLQKAPVQKADADTRVEVIRGPLIPVETDRNIRGGEWLRHMKIKPIVYGRPTPLTSIVSYFNAEGVNIVSDLPLGGFNYVGQINETNAETALRMVLGSMGLDYQVDDRRRMVTIKPIASKTWYLNLGNRRSSFTSAPTTTSSVGGTANTGTTGTSGLGSGLNTGGLGASTGVAGSLTGTTGTTGATGTTATSGTNANNTGVVITSTDDFWARLSGELTSRLKVMVPRAMVSASSGFRGEVGSIGAAVQPNPNNVAFNPADMGGAGQELYVSREIGSFALNPDTGAVTVQAPSWILQDIDTYLKGVQERYNTELSFVGEIVLVTTSRNDSTGLDISSFTKWANGKYGFAVSNNALGGVTISTTTDGGASIAAGAQQVGGALLGMSYRGAMNAMDVFNAYLSQVGNVSIIQKPLLTTTSGSPATFSTIKTDYYFIVNQSSAAGTSGAATTATQNTPVPYQTGTQLTVNPNIDLATGLVRAQLKLLLQIKSGERTQNQYVTSNGVTTPVPVQIPIVEEKTLTSELLLHDGDLIIVGGQTDNALTSNANGLPGVTGPIGGLFGVQTAGDTAQTYYFALRVVVNKRQ